MDDHGSEAQTTLETVWLLQHKQGSGPWVLLGEWKSTLPTLECMGRRGEINNIPRERFTGPPAEVPVASLSEYQRNAYLRHYGYGPAPNAQPFALGEKYTRQQIQAHLGGEQSSYLPRAFGKIVCGCFDPSKDPEAPLVVLPGDKAGVIARAKTAVATEKAVPIFLKRAAKLWEFVGPHEFVKFSRIAADYVERARAAGRTDASGALFLRAEGARSQDRP